MCAPRVSADTESNGGPVILERRLTGIIKNWKGGVPPEIIPKDDKHLDLRNRLMCGSNVKMTHPSIECRGLRMLRG